jgi:ubiquinone/menaquinone biosynthesis C-methylase UbiE
MPWLMATLYDRFMADTERACLSGFRAELLGTLSGDVLEVGAGTGVNLSHYPGTVSRLVLTEPDPHMRARLDRRIGTRGATVRGDAAGHLDLPDESFDVVVSTLVLCTVEDPSRALAEMHRVLRPGGQLVFLEHVAAAAGSSRLRWQRRVEPVWKHLAGNCHVTRDTERSIVTAGFDIEDVRRESLRKAPPWIRPSIRGVARKR